MKTAVLGEVDDQGTAYNRKLLDLAAHYRFLPKACLPYRAKTKGKVVRHVREDFFLGRSFRNLDDLNEQFRHWLDTVANPRRHATTGRVVLEHFAEEQPYLKTLPVIPIEGASYRLRQHADLIPENLRLAPFLGMTPPPRRRLFA
jgi:hypothetical protein